MKKKLRLKSYVLPVLYVCLFALTFYTTLVVSNALSKNKKTKDTKENINYVNESIIEEEKPVINETTTKMLKPYTNENVKIGKTYYDYKADNESQQKSIIYHDNTYMQNSGIDYILDEAFDIVSVLDGTVTSVTSDDLLGRTVEIKHDNNYVSVYQSLGSVDVKKGDTVNIGQVIGKSGTNELDKEMGNHLHFELYVNGKIVDPAQYIDKELNNKKEENKTNDN